MADNRGFSVLNTIYLCPKSLSTSPALWLALKGIAEKFAVGGRDGDMYGITFDLDTNMLERDFGLSRSKAYGEIERVLLDVGFTHIQYSVYFCKEDDGSASFIIKVARALASLDFASAIRDLQGFRVGNWSDMTESIKSLHEALR